MQVDLVVVRLVVKVEVQIQRRQELLIQVAVGAVFKCPLQGLV